MNRFSEDRLFVALLVCLGALLVAGMVWYDLAYPCVRYKQVERTCGGEIYCAVSDANGTCTVWTSNPTYPCTFSVCVERRP